MLTNVAAAKLRYPQAAFAAISLFPCLEAQFFNVRDIPAEIQLTRMKGYGALLRRRQRDHRKARQKDRFSKKLQCECSQLFPELECESMKSKRGKVISSGFETIWSDSMKRSSRRLFVTKMAVAVVVLAITEATAATGQSATDPTTTETFEQARAGMRPVANYVFGKSCGSTIGNISELAAHFNPYGIAGTTVINQEWERYQPFNDQNLVFTDHALKLTATIPQGGGLFPGGINSGQIWSQDIYAPGVTGYNVYAFEVRMKIPSAQGFWPASWFYTQQPGEDDGSEIDNPEFFIEQNQNQFDWTGFDHGPGYGAWIYTIMTNQYVWHPGLDFSAAYHDYQLIWTPDAVYKYVAGTLVFAQSFTWTAPGPASMAVNLAVGTSMTQNFPGLQPTSLGEFPGSLELAHIKIWGK